jgi:uncharacterized membrane protein YfcA
MRSSLSIAAVVILAMTLASLSMGAGAPTNIAPAAGLDLGVVLILASLFFVVAILYTSVGHAGASGYLAAMALLSVAPEVMRPTALVLNIVVAAFTTWRFREARYFNGKALAPFLAGSIPCAFIGGMLKLPAATYQVAVGATLLFSAAYLAWRAFSHVSTRGEVAVVAPPVAAILIGAAIGLLSGLTGTGGGIFLSPMILLLGWAGPKATAGISAPFIMINSMAGLMGGSLVAHDLPEALPLLAGSALLGALVGTWLGIRKLSTRALLVTLSLVMALAAIKLIARAL